MMNEFIKQLRGIIYFGFSRTCPVCDNKSRGFRPHRGRTEVLCPSCGSFERHRFMWLALKMKSDLFDGQPKCVLHFAPEPFVAKRIGGLAGVDYISGDIDASQAMRKIDITNIDFPSDHFDFIICSHVLEHVPDDATAMRELFRTLKPGRRALLQVPIEGEHTHEDLSITDPEERVRLFGQEDHVRQYGLDFAERLASAGFQVETVTVESMFNAEEIRRHGLVSGEPLFFCLKQ